MKHNSKNSDNDLFRSNAYIQHAMEIWGGSVWRIALTQTGSKADAEDVYQDVFIRLAKDRTPFKDSEHLKAWLIRVTVNRCHDLARSSWKRRTTGIDELPFEPHTTDTAALSDSRELWAAVEALPESMRIPIHLFYYEGYSGSEIASILGIKASTIRTRLQRGRAQLRTILGGAKYGEQQQIQRDDGQSQAPSPSA